MKKILSILLISTMLMGVFGIFPVNAQQGLNFDGVDIAYFGGGGFNDEDGEMSPLKIFSVSAFKEFIDSRYYDYDWNSHWLDFDKYDESFFNNTFLCFYNFMVGASQTAFITSISQTATSIDVLMTYTSPNPNNPQSAGAFHAVFVLEIDRMLSDKDVKIDIATVTTTDSQTEFPRFYPTSCAFASSQTVTISCLTKDAEIYYTTNGETPTRESILYTQPFEITETTIVKAIAVTDGLEDSNIVSEMFTKNTSKLPRPEDDGDDTIPPNPPPSGDSSGSTPPASATYTVTFDTTGGSAVNSQSITGGGKATQPADPTKDGFAFDGWYSDQALTTAYDFTKAVTGNITLYAKWVEVESTPVEAEPSDDWVNPFSDVAEGHWYYEAVQYVNQNGIMKGLRDDVFSPDTALTRSMLVQILYNLERKPTVVTAAFTDVDGDAWYHDAVAWAANNGIVNGVGNGQFAPDSNITREQMAVMLHNYCSFKGIDLSVPRADSTFSDANSVNDWAIEAVEAMYLAGILNGRTDGTFDPKGIAARAEVAQMFMNFMETME